MVYLGSKEGTKGSRMCNPKVVVARDVIFNKEKSWAWNNETLLQPLIGLMLWSVWQPNLTRHKNSTK